jgi:glycosyltransferase involved in cell wall biosynthesis
MQSTPASGIIVEVDKYREGAAIVRNRGLLKVTTDWVAFLDSDDQLKANHLETLIQGAQATTADYIYSWYEPVGFGGDPLPHFGKVFDPENPTQTTITTLVRTELAQEVGFREVTPGKLIDGQRYGEDFQFTVEVIAKGGKIVHIPQRTWLWNAHGLNTSGLPTNGDAR